MGNLAYDERDVVVQKSTLLRVCLQEPLQIDGMWDINWGNVGSTTQYGGSSNGTKGGRQKPTHAGLSC